jgi:hypothetical protein
MEFESPFEKYQRENINRKKYEKKSNEQNNLQKLDWAHEVLAEKEKNPRSEKVSDLMQWWLDNQNKK